jgi:cytochrome P450 family 6
LSLEGQEWRERRVKLSPIFTSGKMKMMFETVDKIGDKLVEVVDKDLKDSKTLEMKDLAGRFTADVIGRLIFSSVFESIFEPLKS